MGYRWKPNAAQKREYAAKCRERESIAQTTRMGTHAAIRVGCYVKYYSLNKGEIIEGTVITSSYGEDKGQHTFNIKTNLGETIMVKGRNLYPNIIEHLQGEISKQQSK